MSSTPLSASLRFALLLLCVHAAAAGAAWISIGSAAGVAIALLAMGAGALAIRAHALLLAPHSPARLEFDASGRPAIVDRIGREWIPVGILPRYVNRWFVIVAVSAVSGKVRRVLLTRDMLLPEPFRKLRLWALWGAVFPTA